jgi:predicted ATPase with chaperone activity
MRPASPCPPSVIVNLAPADLPKESSHYDLPIALGIMAAIGAIPALATYTVLGELALDGTVTAVDRHVDVPAIAAADLMLPPPAEGSREVAERVATARDIQIARYYAGLGLPGIVSNAAAPANVIEAIAQPHARGLALIKEALERLHLSARGFHRILKLARTIADLDGAAEVGRTDLLRERETADAPYAGRAREAWPHRTKIGLVAIFVCS